MPPNAIINCLEKICLTRTTLCVFPHCPHLKTLLKNYNILAINLEISMQTFFGKVVWFDNLLKYGFISVNETNQEIFVHYSDILINGYRKLKRGEIVEFSIGLNKRGKPKATNVKIIESI
jgi:CspA family cold shock protein